MTFDLNAQIASSRTYISHSEFGTELLFELVDFYDLCTDYKQVIDIKGDVDGLVCGYKYVVVRSCSYKT